MVMQYEVECDYAEQKRLHRHEHTHTHRQQEATARPFIDHGCVWKMQPSKKMKDKLLLLCTFQASPSPPQLEVGCLSDADKTSRHAEVQSWLFIATQDFICTKLPAADDELQFSC